LIVNPDAPECDEDELDTSKNPYVYDIRFSSGPASYFFDAIDEMLKN